MEISQETRDKITKSAEAIHKVGYLEGKSSKKNQTANEKDLVRIAENVAKRVDGNKNIPSEKKVKSHMKNNLEAVTRDSLIRMASDCLALAFTMPKPVKPTKPAEPTPQ